MTEAVLFPEHPETLDQIVAIPDRASRVLVPRYFIQVLEKVPDELWSADQLGWKLGSRGDSTRPWLKPGPRCAMGHIFEADRTCDSSGGIMAILDGQLFAICAGDHPGYQQPTPKARVLAALLDAEKAGRSFVTQDKRRKPKINRKKNDQSWRLTLTVA